MTLTFKHTHKNIYQINGSPIGTTECQLSPGSFYFYLSCCTSLKPDSRDTDVIPFLLFPIAATPHCKENVRSQIPPWSASESWLMYIFHDVRRHWLLNQALTYIDRFTSTWLKLIQTMMTSHDTIFKKLRGSLNIQLLKVWLVGFVVWHKMTCNEQSWGPKQLVHKVRVWVY